MYLVSRHCSGSLAVPGWFSAVITWMRKEFSLGPWKWELGERKPWDQSFSAHRWRATDLQEISRCQNPRCFFQRQPSEGKSLWNVLSLKSHHKPSAVVPSLLSWVLPADSDSFRALAPWGEIPHAGLARWPCFQSRGARGCSRWACEPPRRPPVTSRCLTGAVSCMKSSSRGCNCLQAPDRPHVHCSSHTL